jgi:hypothetical protein
MPTRPFGVVKGKGRLAALVAQTVEELDGPCSMRFARFGPSGIGALSG